MASNLKQIGLGVHSHSEAATDAFTFVARGEEPASGQSAGVNVPFGDGSVRFSDVDGPGDAAAMGDGSVRFLRETIDASWPAPVLPSFEQDALF